MTAFATADKRQGSTMGTVIVKLTDPQYEVAEVQFYTKVGTAGELGPFPPDILRRPMPGVYEKDVVLDTAANTVVRTVFVMVDGTTTSVTVPDQTFTARGLDAPAGGGTQFQVQDAGTGATAATTLAFQGNVVSVANGVASVNLDSRYATLAGAAFTGDVSTAGGRAVLGMDSFNGNAKLELGSSAVSGTIPYIDFHYGTGTAQDFNARLMNSGDNLLTVSFAGAGTLNVQGTIRQNGTAVSLAGHVHDARYLQLGGGALTGQVTGTVFQTSGPLGAFHVADRVGTGLWAMYGSGGLLRWWNSVPDVDRMTLDADGNLTVGRTVRVAGSNPNWGGAVLGDRTDWAGTAHPTLSSAAGGGLIMLTRPHIPFVTGASYQGDGAYLRMATDAAASHYWDVGTFGDQFAVRRDASSTALLRIDASGRATFGTGAGAAYRLNVEGQSFSTAGFVSGTYLWLASNQHPSTVHGTASYIHTRSGTGVRVEDLAGTAQGYLAFDGTGFGLKHPSNTWLVRGWSGGVELGGRAQDELGNPYATSLSGTVSPTMQAREGALYIQY